MTSTRESRPSCQKSQNNKRTIKSDSSRKSKTKSRNSASNLKKSRKTKSNVTCSYKTPEKPTLNFPLTPNSITSSKTGKPFPVPFPPLNNSLVKRKVESKPKLMANFVPKTKTLTKSGMMKDSTKETERTSETLMKKLRSSFTKSIQSLPLKMMTIDLTILIALSSLIFTPFKKELLNTDFRILNGLNKFMKKGRR